MNTGINICINTCNNTEILTYESCFLFFFFFPMFSLLFMPSSKTSSVKCNVRKILPCHLKFENSPKPGLQP